MWLLVTLANVALALSPDSRLALEMGDCGPVLVDPTPPASPGERLAAARCRTQAGQPASAAALVAEEPGPYAAIVGAEALLALGDPDAAARRLAAVTASGETGERIRLLLGRAQVEAGRYVEARDTLRPLLQGPAGRAGAPASPWGADGAEVRWWLAEGAARRGEVQLAVPVWQAIWSRNPTSTRAGDAARRLAEAGHPVPDPGSPDGRRLVEERIATLEAVHAYGEVLQLRDLLVAHGVDFGASTMANAAFRAKDYPRAAATFASASHLSPSDRFNWALATSRAGDYARAAELYRGLAQDHPGHELADTAGFKIGYLAWDAGDLEAAVAAWTEHLDHLPSSRHADEIRWFVAWSLLRLGRLDQADAAMAALVEAAPGTALATGARYWRARIAGRKGATTSERQGYEAVLRQAPLSSYAWFAARRLGRGPPPPRASPDDMDLPTVFGYGLDLARAGLLGWARAEIAPVSAEAVAKARALGQAGDWQAARPLVARRCPSPVGYTGSAGLREACWPRPAARVVTAVSGETGLEPLLPYAIMTAESALQPEVTSPAGARGLMQLMPEVARGLHEARWPGRPFDADALYQPAYNVALGTAELGRLWSRLAEAPADERLPLVIAGYNAGEDAVARWVASEQERSGAPFEADTWAENIDFTETRRYVKTVLGYLVTYQNAYGTD